MQIVDDERERLALRDVGGEAVEPVEDGERDIRRSRSRHLLVVEEPLSKRSGAGQELLALRDLERGEVGLEQLAYDSVGELLLEIGAPRCQHFEAGCRGEPARLRGEARLACPGPPLDRDHPAGACSGGLDDGLDRGDLRLALEQWRGSDLDLEGPPRGSRLLLVTGLEWREVTRQAVDVELVQRLRPVEVPKLRRPELAQAHVGGQLAPDQIGRRARQEDLAAMPRVADARGLVHREPDVAVAPEARLPRVNAHADAHGHSIRPLVRRERALSRGYGSDRGARTAEDDEEGIALRPDLDSAQLGEGSAQEPVVHGENVPVPVAAECLQQARRPLDVREQERDRARGQGWRSLTNFGNRQLSPS